ncbi:MAG: anti-sigma factor domain-containing protein [Acidimicrobiales bacterium]
MSGDREHQAVAELLGAYSLDAVEPDEMRLVDEHLAQCPRCREEVDQLREVAAALGNRNEEPPPAVWEHIAERIAGGTGERSGADRPAPGPTASPEGRRSIAGAGPGPAAGPRRGSVAGRAWAAAAVALAAAAAVVALAISLVGANDRVSQLRSALTAPTAAVRAALASPGHRLVNLRSRDGAPAAQLVVDRNGTGYVVTSTMPALPASQTYQLWASINGRTISLGLLAGKVVPGQAFSLGSSTSGARELMVTVEPAGGVVAPDRVPVATADLTVA